MSVEEAQAQRIAARLGIPYVDLAEFPIDHDLFRTIPVELMFRYNFIPWKEEDGRLVDEKVRDSIRALLEGLAAAPRAQHAAEAA